MSRKLKPLDRQVMVVTGATSGIGLLVATTAARKGAQVFLIARDETALMFVRDRIISAGGTADFASADVGDAGAVEAAAQLAVNRFGRIDSWINNAGVAIYARLLDTPDDQHARMFATNYFGVVHGCKAAVRHMRRTGGAIITVASIASDMPSPILGAYSASKHAVAAFVRSLRIEVRADAIPISITLLKPSGAATPIAKHAANHQQGEALVPPPPYDPQIVADAVLFCAQYPRREVAIGGVGRLQSGFAQLFPSAFEKLAPIVMPLLQTDRRKRTETNNLWQSEVDGAARSGEDQAIPVSPYTSMALRPRLAGLLAFAGASLLLFYRGRRQEF